MRQNLCFAYWLIAIFVISAAAGCGADEQPASTPSATSTALPALASRPAAAGEIVLRGESSPETHGPYTFDGRYLVRFEQYAPEDEALDFAGQTPLTAALLRRQGDESTAKRLFETATRSGRRELVIRGRYLVDVSFGDFPYVIRFTPRR